MEPFNLRQPLMGSLLQHPISQEAPLRKSLNGKHISSCFLLPEFPLLTLLLVVIWIVALAHPLQLLVQPLEVVHTPLEMAHLAFKMIPMHLVLFLLNSRMEHLVLRLQLLPLGLTLLEALTRPAPLLLSPLQEELSW